MKLKALLFCLILILGLTATGFGFWKILQVEDPAVAQIHRLGGAVKQDEGGTVVEVKLTANVENGDLVHLKKFPNLQRLTIWSRKVTDAGMEELMGLKKLQVLDLSFTGITDDGARRLAELTQLRESTLSFTRVTDAVLVPLSKLKLQNISLVNVKITDASLGLLENNKTFGFFGWVIPKSPTMALAT